MKKTFMLAALLIGTMAPLSKAESLGSADSLGKEVASPNADPCTSFIYGVNPRGLAGGWLYLELYGDFNPTHNDVTGTTPDPSETVDLVCDGFRGVPWPIYVSWESKQNHSQINVKLGQYILDRNCRVFRSQGMVFGGCSGYSPYFSLKGTGTK